MYFRSNKCSNEEYEHATIAKSVNIDAQKKQHITLRAKTVISVNCYSAHPTVI